MGVDSTGSKIRFTGARSDTMILTTIEPSTKQVFLTSIPRDSRVNIPGHGMNKVNSAHSLGGPALAVRTIKANFAVPVDRYVVLDTVALKRVCQLLGPLEVTVEKPMHYTDNSGHLRISLKPGRQYLSPIQVEEYVRFRHDGNADIGRIQRQQWFIRQVFGKLSDPVFVCKLPQILPIVHDCVRTNLSLTEMARLTMLAPFIKPVNIVSATLPGHAQMIARASYWVLERSRDQEVLDRIYVRAARPLAASGRMRLATGIKYTAAGKADAQQLAHSLQALGCLTRMRVVSNSDECVHQQIAVGNARVSRASIGGLRQSIPMISDWPEVVDGNNSGDDLTFVIANGLSKPHPVVISRTNTISDLR